MLLTRSQTELAEEIPEHVSSPRACDGFSPGSVWTVTNWAAQQHRSPGPDDTKNTSPCGHTDCSQLVCNLRKKIDLCFEMETFPYARGRSRASNSSGDSESSPGSFFNRTRYWNGSRVQLEPAELEVIVQADCCSPCWGAELCWSQSDPAGASACAAPPEA